MENDIFVVYRYKSVYEYSTDVIKQLSAQVPDGEKLRCDFDYVGQAFTVAGHKTAAQRAIKTLRSLVEREYKSNVIAGRRAGFVPKVQRIRLSEFNATPLIWTETSDRNSEINRIWAPGAFTLQKEWRPKKSSDFAAILNPIESEADVATMIAIVRDCSITVDLIGRRANIQANDPAVIEDVERKLYNVETAHGEIPPHIIKHLFQTQELSDFEVGVLSLSQQASTIGKTTLFPESLSKYYKSKADIFTLRLFYFEDPKIDKCTPVRLSIKRIPGDRTLDGPRAWLGYLYHGWGTPYNDDLTKAPYTPTMEGPAMDPGDLASALQLLPSVLHAEILDTTYYDRPMVAPPEIDMDDDSDGEITLGPRPNFAARPSAPEISLPTTAQRRLRTSARPTDVPQQSASKITMPTSPKPCSPIFLPEENGMLPLRPKPSTQDHGHMVRAKVRVRQHGSAMVEKMQDVSEQETREMYNISQQKKPSKSSKRSKDRTPPSPYVRDQHALSNLETLYKAIESGLRYARMQRSRMTFKAKIGRVIYDDGPRSMKHMTQETFAEAIREKSYDMEILFTDKVTTDYVDVDFFCDIKLGPEREIFSIDPSSQSVWYEIHCIYKTRHCKIRINAETTEVDVLGQNSTYLKVNYNCPQRSWDACFVMEGRRVLNREDPVFAALTESLYVKGGTEPSITFHNEREDLHIVRAFCKRESTYNVIPPNLTGPRKMNLLITEFQDLHLQSHARDKRLFTACALPREEMIRDQRLWYTFAIVPTELDSLLQAQADLEIGEFGDFTAEEILGPEDASDFLKALVKTVDAVVDRIDNVGYRNKGPWLDG